VQTTSINFEIDGANMDEMLAHAELLAEGFFGPNREYRVHILFANPLVIEEGEVKVWRGSAMAEA
jgi:hypothetical protein